MKEKKKRSYIAKFLILETKSKQLSDSCRCALQTLLAINANGPGVGAVAPKGTRKNMLYENNIVSGPGYAPHIRYRSR
ncbi:hypothetical protein [Burkholderia territorii]|uniref:hypothetical protein n=1 Tax=Burkholderia territorii TaxID=1503055 RepID=UPI0012D9D67C|nr:hypothetical protein [Burkholderia territorii]